MAPPAPWRGAVLTGAAGLAPLVAWLAPLGFAPLCALAGLLCLHLWLQRPVVLRVPVLLFAGLLAWAMVSTVWSPAEESLWVATYEELESRTWLKLILQFVLYVPVILAARNLDAGGAERAGSTLSVGAAALAGLLLVEGISGGAVYRSLALAVGDDNRPDLMFRHVAQTSYILALIYWPAAVVLMRQERKRLLVLLTAGAFGAPVMLDANAPLAALVLSLGVFFLVRRTEQAGVKAVAVAAGLLVALAPLMVLLADRSGLLAAAETAAPPSWAARLEIWSYAVDRIAERPFQGWGLDASRAFKPQIPLHPHDAALQVWLELGAAGAAVGALLWVWLFRSAGEALPGDRTMTGAACAGASVYFVIGALSFGVWQEWWLALGAFVVAWTVAAAKVRAAPSPKLALARGDEIFR